MNFYLEIQPRVDTPSRNEGSIQLSIGVPPIHAQNLWPFSFFTDSVRVSPEEAEDMFGVKIEMTVVYDVLGLVSRRKCGLPSTQELNAMCGFDPARDGEDVRDYFGLYSIKLLDEISTIIG